MDGGLADSIRMAVQWLFAPLLALAVLAWLYVRFEALGVFAAICSAVRRRHSNRLELLRNKNRYMCEGNVADLSFHMEHDEYICHKDEAWPFDRTLIGWQKIS